MIWDCFPYWREHNMVQARQRLWMVSGLDVTMVAFVGDRTHRGNPKPSHRPPPDGVRVVDVVLDASTPWGRENQQRDAVLGLVDEFDRDDLVLLCDADEIVDPNAIDRAWEYTRRRPASLEMAVYPFDTEYRCRWTWKQPKAFRAERLRGASPGLRGMWTFSTVRLAGWHLTSNDAVKLAAFAHEECDTPEHHARIAECRQARTDLEGRPLKWDPIPARLKAALV